jgi:hypothetical protein
MLKNSRASPTQPLLQDALDVERAAINQEKKEHEVKDATQEKLVAYIIIGSCFTIFAPLCLPLFLLAVGILDPVLGKYATKKLKRTAMAVALLLFAIIVIATTAGITWSVRDERRANGDES